MNLTNLNYKGASKCNHHKWGFAKNRFQEEKLFYALTLMRLKFKRCSCPKL